MRFKARQAERTITFRINGPPETTFPLFSAKREMDWDVDWRPDFLADETVFVVNNQLGQSTWVMTRYDEHERAVNYVRITPEHTVGQIWIRVTPMDETTSHVTVTYRLTALSDAGNAFITGWQEDFPTKASVWADVINHYLATGEPLGARYDVG